MDQSQVAESVHKTEHHKGHHNVTRRERGMSRESSTVPVCVTCQHSLGHVLNDCLSNSVTYKNFRHLHSPSTRFWRHPDRHQQRHQSRFLPQRYLLQHFGDCLASATSRPVPSDSQLPQYEDSLQTSMPLRPCWLTLQRACPGTHELVAHEAHELHISCFRYRLRHQICRVHVRADLFRDEPA